MIYLPAFLGDSTPLAIPLTWQDAAFVPGGDWALICTGKYRATDPDSAAVFQKASGAGITVAGSTATVSLVPADTVDLAACNLVLDIQAQHVTTGEVRTVALARLDLVRDVTRLTETSVPVHTAEEPLPFARTATEIHAATAKLTIADADEFALADSADDFVIKKATWGNIRSMLAAHFDPIYSPIAHTHTFASLTSKPTTLAGYGITDADGFGSAAAAQSYAVQRANHTGTQAHTTITGLGTAATVNLSSVLFARSYAMVVTNTATNFYSRIYYGAVEYGNTANTITVAHVISGGGSAASVAVVSRAMTVTCGSACTAETLIAAVNASAPASALVTASVIGPAGAVVTAVATTSLKSPIAHDAKGSVTLGAPSGAAGVETDVTLYDGPGNLIMQNMSVFGALKADATPSTIADGTGWISRMRFWQSHGGILGARVPEITWDIAGSIAIIPTHRTQYGNNSQGRDTAFWQFSSGQATLADPLRRSRAQLMRSNWYSGGVESRESIGWQSKPQADGGNMSIVGYDQATVAGDSDGPAGSATTTGDLGGRQIFEMTYKGIWNRGIAPTFDVLTPGASITQTCSIYRTIQNAKVTLGQNTTLILSGVADGMKGVIYVKQPPTGGPWTLTPDGGSALDLSTTANYLDRVAWEYDGTTVNFQTTKNISQALTGLDADASAFIARNGTTDLTEKSAINTLVSGLKSALLWTKLIAVYPFIGSTATAHSKNLIADAYNITWTGTPTTSTLNGCKGDASTVHGSTGINLSTLGYVNAVAGYACTRGTALTDATYLFGATDVTGRFGLFRNGTSMSTTGANSNSSGLFAATGHIDHYLFGRSSTTAAFSGKGTSYGPTVDNVTGAPNLPIYIFGRNNSGSVGGRTDAALSAAAFFNTSLNSTEWDTVRGLFNAFNTTIGRAA